VNVSNGGARQPLKDRQADHLVRVGDVDQVVRGA
jgi:hypothetical protein